MIAALAKYYSQFGRVMMLVDTQKLVKQNAETIREHTGLPPGIEMGEFKSVGDGILPVDPISCSTPQTQLSPEPGRERFRKFDFRDLVLVILDECESYLSPAYRRVVEWYKQNPELRIVGLTATPRRTDGVAMSNLFDHVSADRDIRWGTDNGWLVPAKPAYVRVSVDFSTLRLLPGKDGEEDYSSDEIASKLQNDEVKLELANGIVKVCEGRKAIAVFPSVDIARAVTDYICGISPGAAQCVYGKLGDEEKDDVMDAHKRGEFQILTSVMMLCRGYNDEEVQVVVNCRKTRSPRLYEQIFGRGTRPLKGILDAAKSAEERKSIIAASKKPFMVMANLVGLEDHVKDMTIIDILGSPDEAHEITERAKKLAEEEDLDAEEAIEKAKEQIVDEQDIERMAAEAEMERVEEEEVEAFLRRRVQVEAHVDIEYEGEHGSSGMMEVSAIDPKHLGFLRKNKVPENLISSLTPEAAKDLSSKLAMRWRKGLCSYSQGVLLQKHGYAKGEIFNMTDRKSVV